MDDPTAARLPLAPARAGVGRTSVGMFAIVAVIWAFSLLPVGALGAAVGELALPRPLRPGPLPAPRPGARPGQRLRPRRARRRRHPGRPGAARRPARGGARP